MVAVRRTEREQQLVEKRLFAKLGAVFVPSYPEFGTKLKIKYSRGAWLPQSV